ncbi:MAG: membrane protein [Candidatus Bathyarchaeia archaeon]
MITEFFKFQWKGWKRFAWDFFVIQIGFLLFGLSVDVIVQANLGLDSWDVLQMALTYHLPITLGEASIAVAFLVVLIDVILKEPLGWGTLANVVFTGVWIDVLRPYVPAVPRLIPIQIAYILLGTLIMGFATAIYVGVNAGAGPRDSLMLATSRLGKTSLRVARTGIEVIVVSLGWFLGGPVWLGTLIAAITIGPAVQLGFKLLKVRTSF